jgi:hypothetical protein
MAASFVLVLAGSLGSGGSAGVSERPGSGAAVGQPAVSSSAAFADWAGELERAASVQSEGGDAREAETNRSSSSVRPLRVTRRGCPDHRRGLAFYVRRTNDWRHKMGQGAVEPLRPANGRPCPYTLWRAKLWRSRSRAARRAYELWAEVHVLRDFRVCGGCNAWRRAVEEVQGPYPGSRGWLLSCSAPRSEGGYGRWVPNREGSGAGGWLQFMESTFHRMNWAARKDVASRAFIVPASAASWYSPLGQALAGGWAWANGATGEWSGSGC